MYPTIMRGPRPWLYETRYHPLQLIEIHATRGATRPELQLQASLNWISSPNNIVYGAEGRTWGASFHAVIGKDGTRGVVLGTNQEARYSAGFGRYHPNGWAIDWYGYSVELAQSQALEEFTDEQYDSAAEWIAPIMQEHNIPPVFVEIPDQSVVKIPTGLVRHDRCENGYKLGKTDPGDQFDEAKFLAALARHGVGDEVTPQDITAIAEKVRAIIREEVGDSQAVFVQPRGQAGIYRLTEDQELVHVVSMEQFGLQDDAIQVLPIDSPIWRLEVTYPTGVPAELLRPA